MIKYNTLEMIKAIIDKPNMTFKTNIEGKEIIAFTN